MKNVEVHKTVLKSLMREQNNLALDSRIHFTIKLNSFNKLSSLSLFRRFCLISNYPKSVFRFFKLSRHSCKLMASMGLLSGMRKSSF